jgi:tetratricopeptide (TPR) repeat protein
MIPLGFHLVNATYLYGDSIRAIEIATKLIHVIEENHRESDFFGMLFYIYVVLHSIWGLNLAYLGRLKEGVSKGEKGLSFANELEHLPSMAMAELFFGSIFLVKGDVRNAIDHLEKALKYCKEGGVDFFLPMANATLGLGYLHMREIKKAGNYLQRSLQIQKRMGLQMFAATIYLWLGLVDLESGNLASAQNYAEKALDSAQKNSERLSEGEAWNFLGSILGKKEPTEFTKAEQYIMKGIKIFEEIKSRPSLSRGYYYLGELYNNMDRKNDALKYLKKAEEMFKEMEMDYYYDKSQELLEKV